MMKQNLQYFNHVISPYINELERFPEGERKFQLIDSRKDVPTLKVNHDGREFFLHSKYDPLKEAERIASRLDGIANHDYIFFYGVGLGYHIEQMMKKYPDKKFVIIEPNLEVFIHFLQSRPLNHFPFNQLFAVYVESETMTLSQFLTSLSVQTRGGFIYVLPAYERIFKEEVTQFYTVYQEALKMTKSNVVAMKAFSKRWVVNSLMNVRQTVRTESIFNKKEHFKNKPVIIAAAGPSLEEDLPLLKQIKENGSAYIFAVGSANKAFIANDITPDAVLTYDPQPHNVNVFRELMTSGHTDIPMIYGTSVGFETTETYPGPLFHFINSADTVTNYYIGKKSGEFDVHDSTTIALIAIQVAEKLGAGQIILAGQNLAFKDERFYATGIKHGDWEGEVRKEREGQNIVTVKDVYGSDIQSNESLVNMRRDIETYIESRPHLKVINTTKGGAEIKGVPFKELEAVIKEDLSENAVTGNWSETKRKEVSELTIRQGQKMERSIDRAYDLLDSCFSTLKRVEQLKTTNRHQQVNRLFSDFDKSFNRLIKTDIYTCFIAPILKIEFDQLKKVIIESKKDENLETRVDKIITVYTAFLNQVQEIFFEMVVHIKVAVHPVILREDSKLSIYRHNDGVFHYEGDWERETVSFNDLSRGEQQLKLSRTISTKSKEKGATIKFRFEGTHLQIYAQTSSDFSDTVRITIDGEERNVQIRNRSISEQLAPKLYEKIFEARALRNEMHDVKIELLSDEPFHFQGIAINESGRVYHVDEVTTIEELEVGKRIRCHYEATINKVGEFSALGKAVGNFIPVESTPNPNGDFYFIMVDDEDGEKKLIADRNVQNYISFNTLMEELPNTKLAGIEDSIIRLLQVSEGDGKDEWLKYIRDNEIVGDSELVWNHVRDLDFNKGIYTFINYSINKAAVFAKFVHMGRNIYPYDKFVQVSKVTLLCDWGLRPVCLCFK